MSNIKSIDNIKKEFPAIEEHLSDMESNIDNTMKQLHKTLESIRTGIANPAMLDGISVQAYGGNEDLKSVAIVTKSDGRSLVVKVYDASIAGAVERAIIEANIGLNPIREGAVIRVPVPEPTGEQRQLLVRKVNEYSENFKRSIRDTRRKILDVIKSLKKDGDLSEDGAKKSSSDIQAIIDKSITEIESIVEKKAKEITTV